MSAFVTFVTCHLVYTVGRPQPSPTVYSLHTIVQFNITLNSILRLCGRKEALSIFARDLCRCPPHARAFSRVLPNNCSQTESESKTEREY